MGDVAIAQPAIGENLARVSPSITASEPPWEPWAVPFVTQPCHKL